MVKTMAINEITPKIPASPDAMQRAPKISEPPKAPRISIAEVSQASAESKSQVMDQISINVEDLHEAIEILNSSVKKVPTSLEFSIDEASNRFVVQVTDAATGEIIRNVPGDAILRMAKQLESLKGILFDDKF